MHLRLKKGSYEYIDSSEYCVRSPEEFKGRWKDVFGNGNEIRLEIGSGRGSFVTQMAVRYPGINFIAIELYASPMYRAVKKAETTGCRNLRFIRANAEFLTDYFAEGEIARIYLNFSDPWPKETRPNKRLTSVHYLAKYDTVLADGGSVEFKTDNVGLFDFTIQQLDSFGWAYSDVTRNLHHSGNPEWNVMTDYEAAFVEKGVPIQRLVMHRKSVSEELGS